MKKIKATPETIGNQFGYLCPQCGRGDELALSIHSSATLHPDGTDESGDHEWDDDSMAWCNACNWNSRVRDFDEAEDFDDSEVQS